MSLLKEDVKRLFAYKSPCWHVHETIVCQNVGLKDVDGVYARDRLSNLINAIRNGYVGNRRTGFGFVSTGRGVADLSLTNNGTNVSFSKHGDKELLATGSLPLSNALIMFQPRYFSFGKPKIGDIKAQLYFVRAVQGRLDRLDAKTSKRRQKNWHGFYTKDPKHTKSFCINDLHVIIEEFPNIFAPGCTDFSACQIICQAIYYSNQGAKRRSLPPSTQAAHLTRAVQAEPIVNVAIVSPSPIKRSRTRYYDSRTMLPTGTVVSMESLRVSAINLGIMDYKAMTPKSIDVEDINDLSTRFISCAWHNVMAVMRDRLSWLQSENLFMIKDGDLLIAWISDGRSTHHDKNRHVLLMTAHKSSEDHENESDLACPCYQFVTASESPSKDSDGNSQLNVESLVNYVNNVE
eukprot:scaffold21443_cov53-Attheya_sp.AAC.2